ncbi:MAG TPA: 2Fe-2S iron-sulfur cluster-binding protein [Moraxellaceae bacterium]|nr:2Fe-2S iron-sulfur cluster-binding protein [Moraxellaceae bacterium]
MGRINFISHDGVSYEAPFAEGQSLMQVATRHGVPGIDGDCGGVCACGTCHVIVDDAWVAQTGSRGGDEEQMLGMTPERRPTSRLACQIRVTEAMDGLTVHLPEFQM